MTLSEQQLQSIRALRDRYAVAELHLFGSVVRGECQPNDVDVMVHFLNEPKLLQFMNLKFELETLLGMPVDLHSFGSCPQRFYERIKGEMLRVA
jgi:uncharacterized protein